MTPAIPDSGIRPSCVSGGNANDFIYGDDQRLVAWAAERIPGNRFRDDAKAIGSEIAGELVAVAVFDTFSTSSCFVSLASEGRRWLTKEFSTVCMAYPFIQLGFARINCLISEHNRLSLRFTRHFGWTLEGRVREAGADGEDLLLFGMLRRECRYLPPALSDMLISTFQANR